MPYGMKVFNELCNHFKLYPEISFEKHIAYHRYNEFERKIYIDSEDYRGIKWAIVHEFAHCVDYARRRKPFGYHHHDKEYYNRLLQTIDVAYRNRKKYPWKHEYCRIQEWARKDGYK